MFNRFMMTTNLLIASAVWITLLITLIKTKEKKPFRFTNIYIEYYIKYT